MTKSQNQQLAAWIFGGTSFAFLIGVFVFGPKELPPQKHLILGLISAFAAGFLGYFITGTIGIDGAVSLPSGAKIGVKAAGAMALFVLVLYWWQSDRSPIKIEGQVEEINKHLSDMDARDARIEALLMKAIGPEVVGEDPTARQFPPELIEQAKLLLERGTESQRAASQILLKNHAAADKIIQELMKGPIDEAFGALTLEGDNWYSAGEFDKAIEPYEQAFALRPDDLRARNNAAIAEGQARLGNIAVHENRAISILQGTLQRIPAGTPAWAATQNNLGLAYTNLPTGNRGQNLTQAITAFEAALTVYTKESDPVNWAATQNNLGTAYYLLPTGDRGQNLTKAIMAYEAALTVYTKETDPADWAMTQNNLGVAYHDLSTGDRVQNLTNAITAYEAALIVRTKEADPAGWAAAQNNLGSAYRDLPTGDRGQNLANAITAFESALTVRTKEADPTDWAATQNNLGIAYADLPTGDRGQNFANAIAAYEAALTVRTKETDPADWATSHVALSMPPASPRRSAPCPRHWPSSSWPSL